MTVWSSTTTLGVPGSTPSALNPGSPTGGPLHMVAENLAFFTALGVVIVFFAAVALGRLAVVGTRDARLAGDQATSAEPRRHESADKPETEDGERPNVWRRLTTTR